MMFGIVVVGLVLLVLVLPFFVTKEARLQEAASVNSVDHLERIKQSLLKRYLEDEAAYERKDISEGVWQKRKHLLTTRYLDAARREDYLKYLTNLNTKD